MCLCLLECMCVCVCLRDLNFDMWNLMHSKLNPILKNKSKTSKTYNVHRLNTMVQQSISLSMQLSGRIGEIMQTFSFISELY